MKNAFRSIKHCIATGCRKPHTGPRFRFLCEKHREARLKQQQAWLNMNRRKRAEARAS